MPGCNIFVGGTIGEGAPLALEPYKKGIPLEEDSLLPELVEIAVTKFGATKKRARKRDFFKNLFGLGK